ncbi:MAG: hypothetical protein ACI9E9_000756 [Reinekea sp.]|jgi:hypothetical protein
MPQITAQTNPTPLANPVPSCLLPAARSPKPPSPIVVYPEVCYSVRRFDAAILLLGSAALKTANYSPFFI